MNNSQTGSITVINRYKENIDNIYIGRGSPFGNVFHQDEYGHDKCIDMFEEWSKKALAISDHPFTIAINGLVMRVLNNEDIYLGCFCKPKRCHGDVIKEIVLAKINNLNSNKGN